MKEVKQRAANLHKIWNYGYTSIKIMDIAQVFDGFYGVIWGVEKWGFFEGKSREFDEIRSFLGGGKKGVIGVSKSRGGRCF